MGRLDDASQTPVRYGASLPTAARPGESVLSLVSPFSLPSASSF